MRSFITSTFGLPIEEVVAIIWRFKFDIATVSLSISAILLDSTARERFGAKSADTADAEDCDGRPPKLSSAALPISISVLKMRVYPRS